MNILALVTNRTKLLSDHTHSFKKLRVVQATSCNAQRTY